MVFLDYSLFIMTAIFLAVMFAMTVKSRHGTFILIGATILTFILVTYDGYSYTSQNVTLTAFNATTGETTYTYGSKTTDVTLVPILKALFVLMVWVVAVPIVWKVGP